MTSYVDVLFCYEAIVLLQIDINYFFTLQIKKFDPAQGA